MAIAGDGDPAVSYLMTNALGRKWRQKEYALVSLSVISPCMRDISLKCTSDHVGNSHFITFDSERSS